MINEQLLRKINQRQIKSLERDARLLEDIARQVWNRYYDTYEPKRYERSYASKQAIQLVPKIEFVGNQAKMNITFEDDYALHSSLWSTSKEDAGNVFTLIDRGWSWKKVREENDHFSHYEGFNYFAKVIEEFNKVKSPYTRVQHVTKSDRYGSQSKDYEDEE